MINKYLLLHLIKKVKAQHMFKGIVTLLKKVLGSLKVNILCRWRCKIFFKSLLERRTIVLLNLSFLSKDKIGNNVHQLS